MLTEEQIIEKYKLSNKQVGEILKTVIGVMAADKVPSNNPLAMVVGGQSGAGKTALINYTSLMSSKRDFVVIDNDYFRAFHPCAAEIKALYPEFYTAATDQIGLGITSEVISHFMGNNEENIKYDLIFHQTLKGNRIADDAIAKLKDCGYTVGVRAFAVPYLESKMSQIERTKAQYERMGFCRHVRKVDHDAAIAGLPNTIRYIEDNGKADFVEVFKRSEDIANPIRVYAKLNPETETQTLQTLSNCEHVCHEDFTNGFEDGMDAVVQTRESEAIKCAKTLGTRLETARANGGYEIPGMAEHIDELTLAFEEFKLTHPQCEQFDNE